MKLVLFTDTIYDTNGVSRFIQNLAQTAQEQACDLTVVSSTPVPATLYATNIIHIKPLWKIAMPFYPDLSLVLPPYQAIKLIFKELQPDIVHISTPGPVGWAALRYAKKFNVPIAGTYHTDFPQYLYNNTGLHLMKRLTNSVMRRFYRPMDLIFSRSQAYIDVLQNDIDVACEKIVYLRPGIDIKRFNPSYRSAHFWENYPHLKRDSIKLLYVGRLTREKNFPLLVEWFQLFKKQRNEAMKDVELIVVGEGLLLAEKKNLRPYGIHLLGRRVGDELSRIYANADFFIFPSVTDTLGQVVMEAQASGLPVIVTDVGGPQHTVRAAARPSGFILGIDNTQAWIDAMHRLSDDAALRRDMGDAGCEMMQSNPFNDSFTSFWSEHETRLAR